MSKKQEEIDNKEETKKENKETRDVKLKNIIDGLKKGKKEEVKKKMNQKIESDESDDSDDDVMQEDKRDIKIAELDKAVNEWKDKCLRQVALADNLKKIHATELEKMKRRANFDFATDILEIYDIMLKAHQNMHDLLGDDKEEDVEDNGNSVLQSIKEGIDMTMNIFDKKLEKNKLVKVGEIGDQFNYDLHQAIQTVDSEEFESNHIVQVVRSGYMMGGELLIPALVIVSK